MRKLGHVEFDGHQMHIVADGAIATVAFGDGKLIPALVVDASQGLAISELIRVHRFAGSGDVTHTWGRPHGKTGRIALMLSFARPFEFNGIIQFDIKKQGGLVDQIIRARGFHLFAGKPGDRFRDVFPGASISVEIVTDPQFVPKWTELLLDSMYKKFRKNGLSRSRAKEAAKDFVNEWRSFGSFRVPPIAGDRTESHSG